jgi:hypothetical protein
MGINTFNISAEREAFELTCDSHSHGDNAPRAWFDSGSPLDLADFTSSFASPV